MSSAFAEFKEMAVVNTLRSCQLFTGLPQPDLQNIANVSTLKSLAKGEYLFHEGDAASGFYVIQRGAVNVHRVTATGKEQIIHVFAPAIPLPKWRWHRLPVIPLTPAH